MKRCALDTPKSEKDSGRKSTCKPSNEDKHQYQILTEI